MGPLPQAINREYRALYGIGVILAAYYVGTWLGSSGFLAVFAAGMATALVDNDICDCFLEYGEITSEMMMLLAFLLFGVVLSDMIGTVPLLPALVFTLVVLAIARPIAISLVLSGAHVSRRRAALSGGSARAVSASLLFGLLLVSSAVPGAEQILAVTGVVVIVSVILHGISAARLPHAIARLLQRRPCLKNAKARPPGCTLQTRPRCRGSLPKSWPDN